MSTHSRIARRLVALLVCVLVFVPVSTAGASVNPRHPGKATLAATLLDTTVKVNGKARIKGELDLESGRSLSGTNGVEAIVVQRFTAGVWVDVSSGFCTPGLVFKLSVSFSVAASYTLRVYHPATTLVAAAQSESFVLAVVS